MWQFINEIFMNFRGCFTRTSSFQWFVVIVTGIMLRADRLGVTSFIRDLALNPNQYESMIHFFRSSSWSLDSLIETWCRIVKDHATIRMEGNAVILVGDGVKQSKEARFMPGVKKHHQESENSSKAEYIFGHLFGGVGIFTGTADKLLRTPLSLTLQDGVKTIFGWGEKPQRQESHVVQLIERAFQATRIFGNSILLLDRYFLSVPALRRLRERNREGSTTMTIVTKAKKSCVAYEMPQAKKPGRGRPPKKGACIKLNTLFESRRELFEEATVTLYGKQECIQFYCIDLLWGQKLYEKLRFVLVEYNHVRSILVSTDLSMDPVTIIRLYSYRFKIECTFREMKQVIGGFNYRFWSKSMPKLKRYLKKTEAHPLENVTDKRQQENIKRAIKAVEGYVQCSCIAMGILQMVAVTFSNQMHPVRFRYLRTSSKEVVSEATVACYLRKFIFHIMVKNSKTMLTQIIKSKQDKSEFYDIPWVS